MEPAVVSPTNDFSINHQYRDRLCPFLEGSIDLQFVDYRLVSAASPGIPRTSKCFYPLFPKIMTGIEEKIEYTDGHVLSSLC